MLMKISTCLTALLLAATPLHIAAAQGAAVMGAQTPVGSPAQQAMQNPVQQPEPEPQPAPPQAIVAAPQSLEKQVADLQNAVSALQTEIALLQAQIEGRAGVGEKNAIVVTTRRLSYAKDCDPILLSPNEILSHMKTALLWGEDEHFSPFPPDYMLLSYKNCRTIPGMQ